MVQLASPHYKILVHLLDANEGRKREGCGKAVEMKIEMTATSVRLGRVMYGVSVYQTMRGHRTKFAAELDANLGTFPEAAVRALLGDAKIEEHP